ncbi:MAG: DegT/DnrJ/EryC1/StrS family aminotransferase [Bacteroidetes bacterium]|nr:DegT/DnrJ/EryC1/StrS family aminotransferase [Bacteroidota bacterium]
MSKNIIEWPINVGTEEYNLKKVLFNRRWWSREGEFVKKFQHHFSVLLNIKHAVCCSSGTVALEIALKSLDIGFLDYVIVPNITFIGTALSVLKVGGIPVFADVNSDTACMDLKSIKTVYSQFRNKVKAIIVVHFGGQCCEIDTIVNWAKENKIVVIEDCAQALGTFYNEKHVGTFGNVGCFSFQNSKNITSGEGGAIVTEDNKLAIKIAKYLDYNYDESREDVEFKYLSGNNRLSEFQGAVLLAQLYKFKEYNLLRENKYRFLFEQCLNIPGIVSIKVPNNLTQHGCHFFMFRYKKEEFNNKDKSKFIKYLNENGIPCWGGYEELPLDQFPYFSEKKYLKYDPFWSKICEKIKVIIPAQIKCPNSYLLAEEFVWIPQFVLLRDKRILSNFTTVIEDFRKNKKQSGVIMVEKNDMIEKFYPINLSEYFNNDGISYDNLKCDGSFDGHGATYPAEEFPESNSVIKIDKIPFFSPHKEAGFKNNLVLQEQIFVLPKSYYKALYVIGATEGEKGNSWNEKLYIKFYDNSTKVVHLGLSNWLLYPIYNEKLAFLFSHLHSPDEGQEINRNFFAEAPFVNYQKHKEILSLNSKIYKKEDWEKLDSSNWKPKLWLQTVKLPVNKKIKQLSFGENLNFHIFAMTLEIEDFK